MRLYTHTAIALVALLFGWCRQGIASGVQVSNLQLQDAQTLTLDLSWEHSWNLNDSLPDANHDAVWLFIKLKKDAGLWQHRMLDANSAAHQSTGGAVMVQPSADGLGVFVMPQAISAGNQTTTLTLALDQPLWDGQFLVRAFAIEMVWVPEGPFQLGDAVSVNAFRDGAQAAPYTVSSELAIEVGTGAGLLSNAQDEHAPASTIPAPYPKGFSGMYAMKYEISQEQYVAFLNTLTVDQQTERTAVPPSGSVGTHAMIAAGGNNRNGIVIETMATAGAAATYVCDGSGAAPFNSTDDGQHRACNYLNWADVLAYLDWSGLRPMTELEFEKICRGSAAVMPGEFAWGTDSIIDANTPVNDGESSEAVAEMGTATAGIGNHGFDGLAGPLRCGFAGTTSTNRLTIGASAYGALEMSGNLWELCVPVTTTDALAFDGSTGDGSLDANGDADVPSWLGATGGHRGGAWNSGIGNVGDWRDLAVSDRWYAGLQPNTRRNTTGGRGVRQKDW